MSLFLESVKDKVGEECNATWWSSLLAQAELKGWKPDEPAEYTTYVTNDGAILKEKDVKSLVEIVRANKEEFKKVSGIDEIEDEFLDFLENAGGIKVE
ncbi:MAG: hypothetical protein ACMG57_01400 [Candidatus Dojkabacteria bacterium]